MAKPLDAQAATVRYGANGRRSCQLHGLFYAVTGKTKSLVYRSEATDSVGQPQCSTCGNEYSKKALEQVKGACGVCCNCPYCHAKLGCGGDEGGDTTWYECWNCNYSTRGVLECAKGGSDIDDAEALGKKLLEAERAVHLDDEFGRMQKDLETCMAEYTASVRDRLGDAATLLSHEGRKRDKTVGANAMGMNAHRLAEFEAALAAKQAAMMTPTYKPQTLSARELVDAPPTGTAGGGKSTGGLYRDPATPLAAGGGGIKLPTRIPLVVRHAVRYQRALLATEMGPDGTRRLNRSAPNLLPRIFISNPLPATLTPGVAFPLVLTFINPTNAAITVKEAPVASSYLCHCAAPAPSEAAPFVVGPKPETDSQRYVYVADPADPATARVVDAWDNVLQLQFVVTPHELPAQHAPREGLGVTLRVVYEHAIDAETLETPLYVFLAFPFK